MTAFGITTAVFGARKLGGPELAQVARTGLSLVELTAAPGHFDPADAAQVADVASASSSEGLAIAAVSVSADAALGALPHVIGAGWPLLVVRAGACKTQPSGARLTPDTLSELLARLMAEIPAESPLRLAVELPAAGLSAGDLARVVESLDSPNVGVCLDLGHAHLGSHPAEIAETLSGFVLSAHLSDNNGREDSHRLPFSGGIDWAGTLTACWKTGYVGPWVLSPAADHDPAVVLERSVGSRGRLQAILEDLSTPMAFTE
jgi:sugar phosphate isomerase/epimerase